MAIVARGGNINSYAGASDPDIGFDLSLAAWEITRPEDIFEYLHHNRQANDPQRYRGLKADGTVAVVGWPTTLAQQLLASLPKGQVVAYDGTLPITCKQLLPSKRSMIC